MDVIAVDDDDAGLELLRMVLESAGHRVRTSADVAGGLRLIAEGPVPAAVVTDLLMGVDRDGGYRLISRIRADPAHDAVAVVALTGVTSADDLVRARAAGADACLPKPIDVAEFLAVLLRVSSERVRAAAG
ncbi:response regulator [Pseudonocardia sp. KRD-184]|uniref:Response regulator n=1 Tax=Pseudonocardia oceani TaxID=2792013 RepID=A0ABS6U9Y3_9PSEU|nr:response regulator [Pseudonocardia oceani]MBW0090485.1 response regulator [Pseudonocardia oceani]MBW0097689.1 response regulator [Pseudonocardia oceani]MBW0110238.1 response regulator [Pseudonocardia oceani]MBW0124341.1 response regulator [Pseudonocardia oceani]MBW0129032.1 response regulator [Pseudonocardia oceani]